MYFHRFFSRVAHPHCTPFNSVSHAIAGQRQGSLAEAARYWIPAVDFSHIQHLREKEVTFSHALADSQLHSFRL
jgi:hypothetical protein